MKTTNTCSHNVSLSTWCNACAIENVENAKRDASDAARYRWLRDKSLGQFEHPIAVTQKRVERGMQYVGPLVGEPLDKAIDAAMRSELAAPNVGTQEKS